MAWRSFKSLSARYSRRKMPANKEGFARDIARHYIGEETESNKLDHAMMTGALMQAHTVAELKREWKGLYWPSA